MKCIICDEETSGSIGGKNICPACDCGTLPQRDMSVAISGAYMFDIAAKKYKLDRAIELLKDMEWSGFHSDDEDSWAVMTRACPVCMNRKDKGHKDSCRLKELIT